MVNVFYIKLANVKKNVRRAIREGGLYSLEEIFGKECSGHGQALFGSYAEDISFVVNRRYFSIQNNGRRLQIYSQDKNACVIPMHPTVSHFLQQKLGKLVRYKKNPFPSFE